MTQVTVASKRAPLKSSKILASTERRTCPRPIYRQLRKRLPDVRKHILNIFLLVAPTIIKTNVALPEGTENNSCGPCHPVV
jgi:hypothetical protein